MSCLIIQSTNGKYGRRCDARCHGATGKRCKCLCGGAFHGIPYETGKAALTLALASKIATDNKGTRIYFPFMQMSLFS